MMYAAMVLLGLVALLIGGRLLMSWVLVETEEDRGSQESRERAARSFYNPRTWAAFRRLTAKRPALLMYRRDKKGRFRKLSPGVGGPASRSVKRRHGGRSRRSPARAKVRLPAE